MNRMLAIRKYSPRKTLSDFLAPKLVFINQENAGKISRVVRWIGLPRLAASWKYDGSVNTHSTFEIEFSTCCDPPFIGNLAKKDIKHLTEVNLTLVSLMPLISPPRSLPPKIRHCKALRQPQASRGVTHTALTSGARQKV